MHRHRVGRGAPWATLVLGHGAGGGVTVADLAALAAMLPGVGVEVVLIEQPWRVAGRPVAPRPSVLDADWRAALADPAVRGAGRLVVGGRSAGARVACRTATAIGAAAVLALAFPLHPPGRPEASRSAELAVGRPLLVVQGARDPFGRPSEFPAGVAVATIPGADHGFALARSAQMTAQEARELLVDRVLRWLVGSVRE
jgi:uncharacterized protein